MFPQKLLIQLGVVIGLIAAVLLYGAWQHHKGWVECKAEYDAEKVKLDKESKDAIKAEQDQADSDKQLIAAYYNRLLSARAKLPGGGVQTQGASGVLPAAGQCPVTETDLRFEQGCAEDAAKLVRVATWLKAVGIKPE